MKDNITKFNHCYDCGLCSIVCPKGIISIIRNRDGFFSPVIVDSSKCIECGLCLNVCAFNNKLEKIKDRRIGYYAAWSNDNKVRLSSSSGGIAYELSCQALKQGYKVIAVKYYEEKGTAIHYIANTEDDLIKSQGSKYIQSLAHLAFEQINKEDKYLVFGTPCQIHSIKNFIQMRHIEDNFILVDFFCHGVPSYNMLDKYLAEKKIITGSTQSVIWRDKSNGGWHNSWNMIVTGNKGESRCSIKERDLFYKFFLKNRCLNEACYTSCKYKLESSAADIRLGDLWGTKYESNEEGVSGVLVLTTKGQEVIVSLENCAFSKESKNVVLEAQMKKPAKKPASYNYTKITLITEKTLAAIDKNASRREFWFDWLPSAMRYYPKRALQKIKGK